MLISVFFGCDRKKDFSDYELNATVNVRGVEESSEVILWTHEVNYSDWAKYNFSSNGTFNVLLCNGTCNENDLEILLEISSSSAQYLTITASYNLNITEESVVRYQGGDMFTATINAQSIATSIFSELKQYHIDFNNPKPTPIQ